MVKLDSCHDANFVVTGSTTGCHYDNLWCHQWRQSWHQDDTLFSIYTHSLVCCGCIINFCGYITCFCALLWYIYPYSLGLIPWPLGQLYSQALYQSHNCPKISEETLKDMGKIDHNDTTKHNKSQIMGLFQNTLYLPKSRQDVFPLLLHT